MMTSLFLKKILVILITLNFALSFVGCATGTPFVKGKSIEVEGDFFSRSFKQDGRSVRLEEIMTNLKKEESSRDKASNSEIWHYTAIVTSGVGGYLVGYNAFSSSISSEAKQTGLLLGVGFLGVAFATAYYSDRLLVEGAEEYNSNLPKKKRIGISKIAPFMGVAEYRLESVFVPTLGVSYQIP